MAGAMVGLLLFLWGMALPLSALPAPIGPAAQLFAEGSRVTVLLTLISGTAGVVLGVVAGLVWVVWQASWASSPSSRRCAGCAISTSG